MSRFRTPLILMAGGFAAKGAAVIAYRLIHAPELGAVLTTYDPLGFRFADSLLTFLFDLRGMAPSPGAPAVFEVLLCVGFALQCFLLGLVISGVRRLFGKRVAFPPIV
jgi:hypothetical protein